MRGRRVLSDLKNRSISAFLWGAGGTTLRILIQIVSQVILARILGPEQFGLFATGLVVVFFTNLFADAGLAYGLVQKSEVTDDDVRFIFTWQMLISTAIAALLYVGAPIIARGFGDERLTRVVAHLAIASIVTAAGGTAAALLRRQLDFRTINIAVVASYAVAFLGLGVPLALAGFGVGALVTAFLVQGAIFSLVAYARVRHPVRPLFWYSGAAGVVGFGANVFGTNLVNWVMSSLDRAIVSATLGVTSAGLYSTVSNLINTPAQSALAMLQPVFYAASAKVQESKDSLRSGLRAMLGAICLFVTPIFTAVSVVAQTIILTLFGTKWAGGEAVLTPMALAVPAILLMGLSTPVLWTAGYPRREFQIQLPMAVLWAFVCYGTAKLGSLAIVSWVVMALFFLRAAAIVLCTMSAVDMSPRELPGLLLPGVAVGALVAAVAFLADRGLALTSLPPPVRLSAVIACCGLAMIAGLVLVREHVGGELKDLLARLTNRLPSGAVRSVVGRVLGASG